MLSTASYFCCISFYFGWHGIGGASPQLLRWFILPFVGPINRVNSGILSFDDGGIITDGRLAGRTNNTRQNQVKS